MKSMGNYNSKTTNGPNLPEMKVCVTLPGKEPWPAELLAVGNESMEWVIEEDKYHLQSLGQL